jgi:mono/diheme cytochrome c family protein
MKKAAVLLVLLATPLSAEEAMRSTRSGVYTAAQADRGHQLYAFRCARCHESGFDGAPRLGDGRFINDFLGKTLFDLTDLIHTSMPVDKPGTTSKAEAADLAAYILSVMQAPAGQNELPPDDSVLQQIRMDAK